MSIDSYRFLDFATRQVMKAWAARQKPGVIPFTPLTKPLGECTIALVSTAGVACKDDRPFYPRFGEADLDVVLPMRRLTELANEGIVGKPAPRHYSTMGYILEPTALVEETAPAIAERMHLDVVDAAALVPA